jgi:2-polyprenyl-3-methyl-5-hydroxy-6-metoxy-1,4-benzoquinol methylase
VNLPDCPFCHGHAVVRPICPETVWGGVPCGCSRCGGAYFQKTNRHSDKEDYWEGDLVNEAVYRYEDVRSGFRRKFIHYLRQLEPPHVRRKNLLEVGCGSGIFLAEAFRRGWTVYGLDVSPRAVELTRSHCPQATVVQGPLRDGTFPPRTFDVVALWDVIEHVEEPEQLLTCVHGLLSDRGHLIMETPDEGCLARKVIRLAHRVTAGRFSLSHTIYYPAHLWYFSRFAMKTVLERLGFKEIRFYPERTVAVCGQRKLAAYHLFRRWQQRAVGLGVLAMGILPVLRNKMVVVATR